MRIGLVTAGGVAREGGLRVVPHLVERVYALSRAHDVQVVALRQEPAPARWTLGNATVHNVGLRPRRLGALRVLARLHRERPLDVLHAFGLVPQGVVVAVAGRALGVPAVLEARGGEFASLPEVGFGGWRRAPGRAWIRFAATAGPLAVPSAPARADARTRGFEAVTVPLEIDTGLWPAAERPKPPGPPWRIAWVGSLAPVKDPAFLVKVVGHMRSRGADVRVDVVGEDFSGGAVRALAREVGVEAQVRFHGLLPPTGVRERLAAAHVLLVTSRYESGPRIVLEAATQGVPSLGPEVGILTEWAPHAATTVRTWTPGAVASAALDLLEHPGRREQLARVAASRLGEHDVTRVQERWIDLYAQAKEMRSGRHA